MTANAEVRDLPAPLALQEAEGVDPGGSGYDEVPPDDEHEHVEAPKLPRSPAHTLTAPSAIGSMPKSRWPGHLLAGKFGFGCSPSGSCGNGGDDDERVDGAAAWVVPLPAVALEGPPELPRSATVAVQPLRGPKTRSNAAVFPAPSSPAATTAALASISPSLSSTPASPVSSRKGNEPSSQRASPRQHKVENSNQRTLKFYPQPSDDRSGVSVDVIEHGYEVLIVRREASPSPRCPPILTEPPSESKSGADAQSSLEDRGTGSNNVASWIQRTPDSGKEDVSI